MKMKGFFRANRYTHLAVRLTGIKNKRVSCNVQSIYFKDGLHIKHSESRAVIFRVRLIEKDKTLQDKARRIRLKEEERRPIPNYQSAVGWSRADRRTGIKGFPGTFSFSEASQLCLSCYALEVLWPPAALCPSCPRFFSCTGSVCPVAASILAQLGLARLCETQAQTCP